MQRKIKLVILFYNAEEYIEKCIKSVMSQTYQNFEMIIVNDNSSDKSDEKIQPLLNEKIIYIKNEQRMLPMYNHQYAVFNHCGPEDIVVHLDGDDYLVDQYVLEYINNFYNTTKCLMMYGQAIYINGRIGNARPYNSLQEFEFKRQLPFYVSHIRTFLGKAFHAIKDQDPNLSCFKDDAGEWYKMSADVAMMYPLMEICGYDKVKYNNKILYVYNNLNPICEYKLDLNLQESIHHEILRKPAFKQVEFNEYT